MGVKASLSFGLLENFLGEMEEEKRERDVAADLRVDTTSTPRVGTTERRRMRSPELARERSLHTRTPPDDRGLEGGRRGRRPALPADQGRTEHTARCVAAGLGHVEREALVEPWPARVDGAQARNLGRCGAGGGVLCSQPAGVGALSCQGGFAVPLPAKGSPRMSEASPLCAVRPGGRISFALHSSLHSFHLQAFGCPLALGIRA